MPVKVRRYTKKKQCFKCLFRESKLHRVSWKKKLFGFLRNSYKYQSIWMKIEDSIPEGMQVWK